LNVSASYKKVEETKARTPVAVNNDELVAQHTSLVKRIAYHLMNRLPSSVQVEDLIQAGLIGLIEAGRNYDPEQGATFETYAGIRIRGSMLDEIRRSDWTPRSVHRKARMVSEAMRAIEHIEGRDARDVEVADYLEIPLEAYHQILRDTSGCRVFSYDEMIELGDVVAEPAPATKILERYSESPMANLEMDGFKKSLSDAIAGLPEKERLVVALYYDEELNLREIGEVLGVSESRVCQIHSQAALRLRSRLADLN